MTAQGTIEVEAGTGNLYFWTNDSATQKATKHLLLLAEGLVSVEGNLIPTDPTPIIEVSKITVKEE